MPFMVMCCQCLHHMTLMVSSITPLHLFVWDGHNKMLHTFFNHFDTWHWHQHHVISMALSTVSLYTLCQGNQNNLQHSFYGHEIPLILVSVPHDANSVINGTIPFARSRWSKGDAPWQFWWCDAICISIMWCQWHRQWYHCICLVKII